MKTLRTTIGLIGLLIFFSSVDQLFAKNDIVKQVFKIRAYEYSQKGNYFNLIQEGSSVLIGKNKVITNAHVVLDENDEPLGNYNLCVTTDFKNKPKCLYAMKLVSYDVENDIALLIPNDKKADLGTPVSFSNKKLTIGDSVKVYGYPRNGGSTITFTEGKVSGMENESYKMDANIDSGNSGGGAFDENDAFIGMPYVASVGLSTLGYIIPQEKVAEYMKGETETKIYNKVDQNFVDTLSKLNDASNNQRYAGVFSFANPGGYGYGLESFNFTDDNIAFANFYPIKNDNTYINISSYLDSLDYDDDLETDPSVFYEYYKENYNQVAYKKSVKMGGKVLSNFALLRGDKKNNNPDYMEIYFKIKSTEVTIATDSYQKNKKDFINGLNFILKEITVKGEYNHKEMKVMEDEGLKLVMTGIGNRRMFDSYGNLVDTPYFFHKENDVTSLKYENKIVDSFDEKSRNMSMNSFFQEVDKYMTYENDDVITNEIRKNKNEIPYRLFVMKNKDSDHDKVFYLVQFIYENDGHVFNANISGSSFYNTKDFEKSFIDLVDAIDLDGNIPFSSSETGKIKAKE